MWVKDINPVLAWMRLRYAWGGVSPGALADRCARLHGDKVALVVSHPLDVPGFARRVWSFADVGRFVGLASAALLRTRSCQLGDKVAVCTGRRVDQPLLCLAVMRCGAVAVPMSSQLRGAEVAHIIEDCAASVLVVDQGRLSEVVVPLLAQGRLASLRHIVVLGGENGEVEGCAVSSLGSLWDEGTQVMAPVEVGMGAVCGVFYTSGTTGKPKGAMLTGQGLLGGMSWGWLVAGLSRQGLLTALPSAHIMGFASFLGAMVVGVRHVVQARFVPEEVLEVLTSGDVAAFVGVPSMFQMLEGAGALSCDLRGVRVWGSAADVMPPALMARFKAAGRSVQAGPVQVPSAFVEIYGSVELSGAAMVRVSAPWLSSNAEAFVGWPLAGIKVEVRAGDGRVLERGQVGDLYIKGEGVMGGYLGQGAATRSTVQEGWLCTGDLASRGRWGQFRFVGRAKEVIKVGGYSVFPAEVEALLSEHPAVSVAVVFGVSHGEKGAVPVAVVCSEGVSEAVLLSWATSSIARYKAPRRIFIVERADLPLGATGKVLRRSLQARYEACLG